MIHCLIIIVPQTVFNLHNTISSVGNTLSKPFIQRSTYYFCSENKECLWHDNDQTVNHLLAVSEGRWHWFICRWELTKHISRTIIVFREQAFITMEVGNIETVHIEHSSTSPECVKNPSTPIPKPWKYA